MRSVKYRSTGEHALLSSFVPLITADYVGKCCECLRRQIRYWKSTLVKMIDNRGECHPLDASASWTLR